MNWATSVPCGPYNSNKTTSRERSLPSSVPGRVLHSMPTFVPRMDPIVSKQDVWHEPITDGDTKDDDENTSRRLCCLSAVDGDTLSVTPKRRCASVCVCVCIISETETYASTPFTSRYYNNTVRSASRQACCIFS